MKMILIIVVALVIAVGLAYQVHLDPGYALLGYGDWSVETSFAVLIFAVLVLFAVLYILARSLSGLRRAPAKMKTWNAKRKTKRSQKELVKGLVDSAEGNWRRSEKLLARHAGQSETPLLNYLSAAHAAQSQGAYDRRDQYLLQAGEALPEQSQAIQLTRAKLQLSAGQYPEAIDSLKQLQQIDPKNAVVLSLLMRAYQQSGNWTELRELLPALRRSNAIDVEEWKPAEHQTYSALLEQIAATNNPEALTLLWDSMPSHLQLDPDFLTIYVDHMVRMGEGASTEAVLLKALNQELDDGLLRRYSQLDIDLQAKTQQLDKWSRKHPDNTCLLSLLGGLYLQQDMNEKAQAMLESSIQQRPTPDAMYQLGQLLEKQGNSKKAAAYYREALAAMCGMRPHPSLSAGK